VTQKRPCAYILASQRNGRLYVGVTSEVARRVWEHRSNAVGGFVQDYAVHRLVFVEFHETMAEAILREKRIKKWQLAWKLELIERQNPLWRDLYDELILERLPWVPAFAGTTKGQDVRESTRRRRCVSVFSTTSMTAACR
jgi:putative endonuclease